MKTKTDPQSPFEHLTLWKYPRDYFGADWSDYYILSGQHRDSDALAQSNFRSFLSALKTKAEQLGASEVPNPDFASDPKEDEAIPAYTVACASHWAVGWVETLLVHRDAHPGLLEWADQQLARMEGYPVFDEHDFCELESEQADQTWRECYRVQDRIEYIRKHRDQFEFRSFADLLGCVRGQYFAGYASELLN
jgi:hypothetical protein